MWFAQPKQRLHRVNSVTALIFSPSQSRTFSSVLEAYPPRKKSKNNSSNKDRDRSDDDANATLGDSQETSGNALNWIEKSSPTGIGKLSDAAGSIASTDATVTKNASKSGTPPETDGNYDLGIQGVSFSVGPLSQRMYDALVSVALKRFPRGTTKLPSELEDIYRIYAMDITAKEAVKAALQQNGLELALSQDDEQSQDAGLWGEIDSIQLVDATTGSLEGDGSDIYSSLQEAVEEGDWSPGQPFNFVVRNVPAKLKEMDISDLLQALDPDGKYRNEAKEKGMILPDEDILTLKDLGNDNELRSNAAPRGIEPDATVYKGDGSKGYAIMPRSDLLRESTNADGSENYGSK